MRASGGRSSSTARACDLLRAPHAATWPVTLPDEAGVRPGAIRAAGNECGASEGRDDTRLGHLADRIAAEVGDEHVAGDIDGNTDRDVEAHSELILLALEHRHVALMRGCAASCCGSWCAPDDAHRASTPYCTYDDGKWTCGGRQRVFSATQTVFVVSRLARATTAAE